MTEQLAHTPANLSATGAAAPLDAWNLAKKRTNDYLKLHRLPDVEREHLLARISHRLAHANVFVEAELIQLFLSTAQEELALVQTSVKDAACCQCKKTATQEPQASKPDNRNNTGPRFERSSIRVAPLQSISLLPSRSRQRSDRHAH